MYSNFQTSIVTEWMFWENSSIKSQCDLTYFAMSSLIVINIFYLFVYYKYRLELHKIPNSKKLFDKIWLKELKVGRLVLGICELYL